ncbi:PTS sugar transporter subunit IIB [Atopobium sp. oral taxon 416]|jgi:PTS system ascorbate-specific IIB component|uniref:PTS sugar transporter subunit IIB n=1 Tax=Atopobium sp. oral taxon 416 TaxID=712157 RepID=UPI001BAC5DF3|nr:PTS sugar transporter subunit IIB [Atopobium sp. oral taxon 416]QUC03760.1 PTS sugar transporter subunit IIB [Atopobium sp. oral taxon 416]
MVRIVAVCGAGLGSSFACQMAIEQAMQALGVNAKVSHTDTSTISAIIDDADVVVSGKNYQKLMEKKNLHKPVVFLDRLVDKVEITEKLTPILKEMRELK